MQQLRDTIVEALLELESSPGHTILVGRRPLVDEVRLDSHRRIELRVRLAVQLGREGVVAGLEELVDVVGDLFKGALEPASGIDVDGASITPSSRRLKSDLHAASEPVPRPLQRVLDLVGEVF